MNAEQNKLLTKMKKLIREDKRKFENRYDRNYIEDLLELGISVEEAWNQILMLNSNFLYFDEKPIYSKSKNSLVFKKKIYDTVVYIKIKLEIDKREEIVVCLSFHKDKKKRVVDYEMSSV